ncbi:MAG TPA: ACP phosphodiesterase [Verrucomicrobiota bacterium]|nr:ACP phosphodiesterase [Verrucomicrobiota bacterium]
MNWLAHAFLSEDSPAFRLGNLLPDFLSASELAALDPLFQPGIRRHHWIDRFTDRHPVVRNSVRRFASPYRRVAPVLVDVFYDHFLSAAWSEHSRQPLSEFVGEIYQSFARYQTRLPPRLGPVWERMQSEDWLGAYQDFSGLARALSRMERRLRRRVDLAGGLVELRRHYAALADDFRRFFPELRAALPPAIIPDNSASRPASP